MQNNQRHGSSWDNFGFGNHAHWSALRGGCAKRKNNRAQVWHNFIGSDMCSTRLLLLLLLSATIIGQISGQFLSATVGGSVLIPCSLSDHPLSLKWLYWQEEQFNNVLFHWEPSGQTLQIADKYRDRCQVFPTEFSSGNISIRLDNVTVGDDNKTFFAYVRLMDEKESKKHCKSTLQVSAPFQKPNIEINQTEMTATCSTNGGYPEPELKWSGDGGTKLEPQKTTMTPEADLTYNISSRVNVTGLQKVTCTVYNPTSNQTLTATKDVSPVGNPQWKYWLIGTGIVIILILIGIGIKICVYYKKRKWNPLNANEDPARGNVPDAQPNVSVRNQPEENSPLRRRNGGTESLTNEDAASGGGGAECGKKTSASGGDAAEEDASDAHSNTSGGSRSAERVSLGPNQAVFHRSTGRKHVAADSSSDEDTAGANAEQGAAKPLLSKNGHETSSS
ncbi:CD276 antigen-like [Dicentrarchus labrax]|uniref:CD276 antigen-like n=1 Tax=Dicentrarchus labrax TaxID=13489 RepID=UPI0021F675C9|nr:CD276 antigen-like [Dicentrarchus labrax]